MPSDLPGLILARASATTSGETEVNTRSLHERAPSMEQRRSGREFEHGFELRRHYYLV